MTSQRREHSIEKSLKELTELVRDQLIVQLGLAGVPQQQIREIVKVDMIRVNQIAKRLKKGVSANGNPNVTKHKSTSR
jgi:hypothetical protein